VPATWLAAKSVDRFKQDRQTTDRQTDKPRYREMCIRIGGITCVARGNQSNNSKTNTRHERSPRHSEVH